MESERAKILLEASRHLHALRLQEGDRGRAQGIMLAAKELKRLASAARDEHKVQQAKLRQQRRWSNAKAKAFGME